MYELSGRIKYSEVGEDGQLMLHQLLNYFQDCSSFHLEDLNIHMDQLNMAFYMLSWQIEINRMPTLGEKITVGTLMHEGKGAFGYRNYVMRDANHQILAYANMIGCFVNAQTSSLLKLTAEDRKIFPLEEKLEMEYLPRKIKMPTFETQHPAVLVSMYHIDMNHHVNNSQYAALAMNYLPQEWKYRRVRIEYKMAAKEGQSLIPQTIFKDNCYYLALCNEMQEPYVILAFSA